MNAYEQSTYNPLGRPSAQDVARRLVILRTVAYHQFIVPTKKFLLRQFESEGLVNKYYREVASRSKAHWDMLRDSGLWNYLTPSEKAFADSPPALLTTDQIVDAGWKAESATALLWALRVLPELPSPTEQTSEDILFLNLHMEIDEFVASAELRSVGELEVARAIGELWSYRSQLRELSESGRWTREDAYQIRQAGEGSLDEVIRGMVARAAADGVVEQVIDGDLGVRGKAYRDLLDEEWSQIASISLERCWALNWACGYAPGNRWDETPTHPQA